MTLLVALRKIRHPNVIDALKTDNKNGWYALGSMKSTSFKYNTDVDELQFEYNTGHFRFSLYRKYSFLIGKEHFSMRITEWDKNETYSQGNKLANINNIPYNVEPEALLFQLSLENKFCTFGVNEFNAILKFRERFWGAYESTSEPQVYPTST